MELIGEKIKHKTFGIGIIEELNNGLIVIRFSKEKISRFKFPDAFACGFLCAINPTLSQYITQILTDRKCDICGIENIDTTLIEGRRLCHTCKVEHTSICSMCGNSYISLFSHYVSDYENPYFKTQLCKECADKASFTCQVCGHRYFRDHIFSQSEGKR